MTKTAYFLVQQCLLHFVVLPSVSQYLEKFLQRGQQDYKVYCTKRLQRIVANGERRELPCWMELQVKPPVK